MTEGLQKMPSNESLSSNRLADEKGKLGGVCSSHVPSQG